MSSQTVTIAPIASRTGNGGPTSDGIYKTAARPLPAGTYQTIQIFATFNNEPTDFLTGDVIYGQIDISYDGGATWQMLVSSDPDGWRQGAKGRNGLYYNQLGPLVVPVNTQYRATARVAPAAGPTGSITFGVNATVTT